MFVFSRSPRVLSIRIRTAVTTQKPLFVVHQLSIVPGSNRIAFLHPLSISFNPPKYCTTAGIYYLQRQAHPEQEQPADLLRPPQPAGEQAQAVQVPEDEPRAAAKATQNKKKTIADFDKDLPPPSFVPTRPSQYTLSKLQAFEYVELWYFTKEGCFEALKQARSQPEDTYGLLLTENILTLCPVASVKASKNAKSNHELSLTEGSRLAGEAHQCAVQILLEP
ncbi:hypothetical protein JVU11DRAFT_12586 [Chiua virens]|nr:hypothetical protein JVU11DRAFT_12586 [Chiua virens]